MESIQLKNPTDIQFANIAQAAKVSGATLPSGFEVPTAPDGEEWVVFGASLVLVHSSPSFAGRTVPD